MSQIKKYLEMTQQKSTSTRMIFHLASEYLLIALIGVHIWSQS